ncbi:5-oxoprolinase subunit PxpB [Vibrio sp. WJH972]
MSLKHEPLLQFSFMGEGALLCEVVSSDGRLQLDIQQQVWKLGGAVSQGHGVLEVVPGMNNILIIFNPMEESVETIQKEIKLLWSLTTKSSSQLATARVHVIPVSYGGEVAKDILDLATYAGLSVAEVIKRHSEAEYTVYALGSQPGLPYLGGLDSKLAMPRREVPRTRVEAGAIIIGGSQASILSCTSACGWHIIGQTDVECFNPNSEPPALFSPGDVVRFHVKEELK